MKLNIWRILAAFTVLLVADATGSARDLSGRVVDAQTGTGIADASVTVDDRAVSTDAAGRFRVDGVGNVLRMRAPGYLRQDVDASALNSPSSEVRLQPFVPKALYLSFYGIGNAALRNAALALIRQVRLNAVVIDVKGDRGMVAFPSAVPLATAIGAQRVITIPNLKELLRTLHEDGLYTIARIVVLKDDPLASARPDLAIKQQNGAVFHDREGLRWVDPTQREVWDYNIAIAAEAAAAGFDEIQFDYLRFPDSKEARLPAPNTQESRTRAIAGFIKAAGQRLIPYNVFLAVDVFGYICWNVDDTHIGQKIEDLLPLVDYLSPMLYPSGFQFGIPGYQNPVAHVYEIVRRSLDRVRERTDVSPRRLRPWLQAFKDYAFDRREFNAYEIREQIRAAEDFGTDGWMLWNPRNVYSDRGLTPEITAACW
jgi:hypothetical protein